MDGAWLLGWVLSALCAGLGLAACALLPCTGMIDLVPTSSALGWERILGEISYLSEWWCVGTAAQGVLGSPSLRVFQNRGDVALRDTVSGYGGEELLERSFPTSMVL